MGNKEQRIVFVFLPQTLEESSIEKAHALNLELTNVFSPEIVFTPTGLDHNPVIEEMTKGFGINSLPELGMIARDEKEIEWWQETLKSDGHQEILSSFSGSPSELLSDFGKRAVSTIKEAIERKGVRRVVVAHRFPYIEAIAYEWPTHYVSRHKVADVVHEPFSYMVLSSDGQIR